MQVPGAEEFEVLKGFTVEPQLVWANQTTLQCYENVKLHLGGLAIAKESWKNAFISAIHLITDVISTFWMHRPCFLISINNTVE